MLQISLFGNFEMTGDEGRIAFPSAKLSAFIAVLALAGKPRLLLMDEPTAGMAAHERAGLMAQVAELAKVENVGVLFTEHDMDAVFTHADHVLVLHQGAVVARGTPEEIRADPHVRAIYLGTAA